MRHDFFDTGQPFALANTKAIVRRAAKTSAGTAANNVVPASYGGNLTIPLAGAFVVDGS